MNKEYFEPAFEAGAEHCAAYFAYDSAASQNAFTTPKALKKISFPIIDLSHEWNAQQEVNAFSRPS